MVLATLALVVVAGVLAVRRRSVKHAVLAGVVLVLGLITVAVMRAPPPSATRPRLPASEADEAESLSKWRACNTIKLDPKTAGWIAITNSTMVLPGEIQCEVVGEAQMNLDDLRVHLTLYDKDEVKLGADELHFQNLAKGEKQKVRFWVRDGTTKIVSKW